MWICFSETFIRKIKVSIVTKTENKQEYFVCSKNTFLVKKEWWQKYSLGQSQTTRSAMIIICPMYTVQVRKITIFSTKENVLNGPKFSSYFVICVYTLTYDTTYISIKLYFIEKVDAVPTLKRKENKLIKHQCGCIRNESYVTQLFLFQTKMSSLTIMPIEQRQSLSLGYIQLNHIP